MSTMNRAEERQQKALKLLRAEPANKNCMDCDATFPSYIVMDFGTWVCNTCSGIHREFTHKIKSPSMSTFKDAEIKELQSKGNAKAQQLWRARWREEEAHTPHSGDVENIRKFIQWTYQQERWKAKDGKGDDTPSKVPRSSLESPNSIAKPAGTGRRVTSPAPIIKKEESLIDFDFEPTPTQVIPPMPTSVVPSQGFNPFAASPSPSLVPPTTTAPASNFYNPFATATEVFAPVPTPSTPTNPFSFPDPTPQVHKAAPANMDIFDIFGLPAQSATNGVQQMNISDNKKSVDQFDFPSLKGTQMDSDVNRLQAPPPLKSFVKPSPIQNQFDHPTEKKKGPMSSDDAASCPICGKSFARASNVEINQHIDQCLNADAISKKATLTESSDIQPSPSNGGEPWAQWFDLSKMDWYYGSIDRKEAERLLLACSSDSFLVRKSSVKGSFAMSLFDYKKRTVTHTLIEPRDGGYGFQDHARVYATMIDLISKSPECRDLKPPPKTSIGLE